MEETPLVYFEGQLTEQEHALLRRLLQRAEQVGDFPPFPADEGQPWLVVAAWGEVGSAHPVSVSRFKTNVWFRGPTAEDVAEQIEAWIDAKSPNEAQ